MPMVMMALRSAQHRCPCYTVDYNAEAFCWNMCELEADDNKGEYHLLSCRKSCCIHDLSWCTERTLDPAAAAAHGLLNSWQGSESSMIYDVMKEFRPLCAHITCMRIEKCALWAVPELTVYMNRCIRRKPDEIYMYILHSPLPIWIFSVCYAASISFRYWHSVIVCATGYLLAIYSTRILNSYYTLHSCTHGNVLNQNAV